MTAAGQRLQPAADSLSLRALAGVLRNAQDGNLPLFAWTLGLPQPALLRLVGQCFPEANALAPLPALHYEHLRMSTPVTFVALVELLCSQHSAAIDEAQADWLARVVAAACFGERHLWQDLDLAGRDEVSCLLQRYFEPLYQRNRANLRWKRFLFAELGAVSGDPGLRPPGCGNCEQYPICFTDES